MRRGGAVPHTWAHGRVPRERAAGLELAARARAPSMRGPATRTLASGQRGAGASASGFTVGPTEPPPGDSQPRTGRGRGFILDAPSPVRLPSTQRRLLEVRPAGRGSPPNPLPSLLSRVPHLRTHQLHCPLESPTHLLLFLEYSKTSLFFFHPKYLVIDNLLFFFFLEEEAESQKGCKTSPGLLSL